MGIGGAVLYSMAFMAVRGLWRVGVLAAQSLRWLGRAFLDGAALYGASFASVQLFHDPRWGRQQEWRVRRPEHDAAAGD